QRRENSIGDKCAVFLPHLGTSAKKRAQRAVGGLGQWQHRGERVGKRAEPARTNRHCCATASSTRMLSSSASTVARSLERRSFTATKCSDGASHTCASREPSPPCLRQT